MQGGNLNRNDLDTLRMNEQEDISMVALSGLHLDSPRVMEKLAELFAGYEDDDDPPVVIALMGNFSRYGCKHGKKKLSQKQNKTIVLIISIFYQNFDFVFLTFVSNDIFLASLLPLLAIQFDLTVKALSGLEIY